MKQITDQDRFEWLLENITYMEHNPKDITGYWPQEAGDGMTAEESLYMGMDLREYIDFRMKVTE